MPSGSPREGGGEREREGEGEGERERKGGREGGRGRERERYPSAHARMFESVWVCGCGFRERGTSDDTPGAAPVPEPQVVPWVSGFGFQISGLGVRVWGVA